MSRTAENTSMERGYRWAISTRRRLDLPKARPRWTRCGAAVGAFKFKFQRLRSFFRPNKRRFKAVNGFLLAGDGNIIARLIPALLLLNYPLDTAYLFHSGFVDLAAALLFLRLQSCCFPTRICCCWTSLPTTLTFNPWSGLKNFWRIIERLFGGIAGKLLHKAHFAAARHVYAPLVGDMLSLQNTEKRCLTAAVYADEKFFLN